MRLVAVFLLAVSPEADNDFHVIVSDDINYTSEHLMNAEMSALPAAGNATLQHMRDAFETHFDTVCGTTYKVFLDNAERITVEGSLF